MAKIKSITMYSTSWCSDCFRARAYFDQNDIEYKDIDIEKETEFIKAVEEINNGMRSVPTIIFQFEDNSTKVLVEPTNEELDNIFEE